MGLALIFMAVAVGSYLLYGGFSGKLYIEELTFDTMKNMHADPANNILFPMLFIVISCGAISGFHATQSPMMARCMTDEKYGRPIFYGAMISEGIVAMIWATACRRHGRKNSRYNRGCDLQFMVRTFWSDYRHYRGCCLPDYIRRHSIP